MFLVLTAFVSIFAGILAFAALGSVTASMVASGFLGVTFFYMSSFR